jgi:hypothetical protein
MNWVETTTAPIMTPSIILEFRHFYVNDDKKFLSKIFPNLFSR